MKSLWDHLKQINSKKIPANKYWAELTDADKKTWSSYMISRLLSMNSNYVEIINFCQQYSLEPEMMYKLYMALIPQSSGWHKYIKAKKQIKYEEWIITLLTTYYEISIKEAIEYLDIYYLSDKGKRDLKEIVQLYGTDKKLIKKAKL